MNPPKQITRRWINNINSYNFEVYHIKGKKNTFSDYLSRTNGLKNVKPNNDSDDQYDSPLVICAMNDQTQRVNYNQFNMEELNNLDIRGKQNYDEYLKII